MKMLFVMTSLKSGGIVSSLINLIKELSASKQDVEIGLLLFDTQKIRYDLPENVNIIKTNSIAELVTISFEELKRKNYFLYVTRLLMAVWTKFFGDYLPYKFICATNRQKKTYDIAISYTQSAPNNQLYGCCNEIVLNSVKAKQKIAFIHCDYIKYGINSSYSRKLYNKFDKIATVSQSSRDSFIQEVPEVENKTYTVFNCQDYRRIIELSEMDPVQMSHDVINLCTVARIGPEKGHLRLIEVLKEINEKGMDFRWHVIGDGNPQIMAQFKDKILEYKLSEKVILYGDQDNPYRILKNSDALLLMSFHECAPMVFYEAYTLGVPVLTTDTLSAIELVSSRGYGIVCDNSEQGLTEMLEMIIKKPRCLDEYRKKIRDEFCANNDEALVQFWRMIHA